jgi:quercetin dioxygenase-like cupin family protein
MRFAAMISYLLVIAIGAAVPQTSSPSSVKHQSDRVIFLRSLPQLDGKNLRVTMVEVNYGPGESSKVHSHPCPVIGYVLEGSLRMKVTGESEAIYKTGDTFYEAPNGVHEVSANASHTMPAKFVAYFVCDREMPLSVTPISNQGKSQ